MDAITCPITRTCRRPRRGSLLIGVGIGLTLCALLGPPVMADPDVAETALRTRLDQVLTGHKQPKAVLAARVIDLQSGRIIYDRDGHRPMIPASNMKLVVIAAAIEQLGADYQFETTLAIRGKDLIVIGGGDPTIGDERLAEQRNQPITAVFHQWAELLLKAGVKQIPGNVVVDDSLFDDKFVHAGWPADQFQRWYEAPVGGLNFADNCVEVRVRPTQPGKPADLSCIPGNPYIKIVNKTVTGGKNAVAVSRQKDGDTLVVTGTVTKEGSYGPIAVYDPGLYFGNVLKTVLASKGVRVVGKVVREKVRLDDGSIPPSCHVVTVCKTPLRDALGRAGKHSLGMMAEALIKMLGRKEAGKGSWESGAQAVESFLHQVGVPADQATLEDGSGLSRSNRLSPAAAADVLQYMFKSPGGGFEMLRDSLACAGIDGTLEKRLRGPATKGRVYAKTGYIKGVCTLAGYVHTSSGQWLAFAFYYNQSVGPADLKKAQDQACELLVSWPDIKPAP